ncbi:Uncharacterised protein [Mycobacteroides abscessus subsp. abscessus]|nr:Uncharacterised protein [Mycobacteroides abscessus subsp. abscessus]
MSSRTPSRYITRFSFGIATTLHGFDAPAFNNVSIRRAFNAEFPASATSIAGPVTS